MIPAFFKTVCKRFALLMVAYSLSRVLFMVWNWDRFEMVSAHDLFLAYFYGLRFDAAAILTSNAPMIAFWLLPPRWLSNPVVKALDLAFFGVINLLCLSLNFVDAEFVKFVGKRTSYDIFMMREDIQRQAISVLSTYWYMCFGVIFLLGLLVYLTPIFRREDDQNLSWRASSVWRVAAVGLVALGMRGGFQFKPLHPMDAYFSTNHNIALLTLNTPFTMMRSKPRGEVEHARYFKTDREAIEVLRDMTDLSRPPLATSKGWNVVVLIIESFGSEYTSVANNYKGYTPFFDSLAREPGAFFFKYDFANSRRSIEGLPAVICGLPSFMQAPILTSDFSNNHFECLPKILARHGYSTYFLHGAHNGSMHFDSFARIAGFENFVGLNEYPKNNPEDFDHYWGVLDEPMLQYAAETMDRAPKPALIGLFTLSSHHPYYIPPKYAGKFPKGNLEILESIGYTDYSLRKFFETARTKPWFKNTIFVLTADHTQKTEHKEYDDLIGWHRVPLLIYAPGLKDRAPKVDPDRITQQIDIMPSVLDLLGIQEPNRLLVGQSVFDNGKDGHSYNYTSESYWYLDKHVLVDMGRGPWPLKAYGHDHTFDWQKRERPPQGPEVEAGLLKLKAVVQYLSEGLLRNNLYEWPQALK